jgi:hypothetical protein
MSVYSKNPVLHITILCGLIPAFLSCSSGSKRNDFEKDLQVRKMDFSIVSKGDGPRLSEAVDRNLSKNELSPNRKKLLNLISEKTTQKKYTECSKQFHEAVECQFLKPEWNYDFFVEEISDEEVEDEVAENGNATGNGTADANSVDRVASVTQAPAIALRKEDPKKQKKRKKRSVSEVIQNLKKGITEPAKRQQPGDYYHALKAFPKWTPELNTLAEKLKSDSACTSIELYHYLGLKAEEFLPEESMLDLAVDLYRKGGECFFSNQKASVDKYLLNSQFRLGLFLVMKDRCDEAKPVFSRLAKIGQNDYSTRALYWNAYCSKMESKREEFIAAYDQLFKANPLGFHTLSFTKGNSLLVGNLELPIDPMVKTRSTKDSNLNSWIQAIEDLEKIGNYRGVMKLLSPVRVRSEYLDRIEPGVSLYLATFANRAKDSVSLFRLLDSVFRTQNEYVVNATLKLFYPLKYLDQISEKVSRVNPFLITALIRQESAFQEKVKSKVGAMGLMQLMPRTARLMDRTVNKKKLMIPEVNIRIGIRYFEMLVDRFEGDVELALAAYNAGPEAVDRWKKRYPMTNRLLFLDLIPYSETRNYVTLIGRNYYWYSRIYANDAKSILNSSSSNLVSEFRSLNGDEK